MAHSIPLTELHDKDALIDRLTYGLDGTEKEVVFVVGAPLTQDLGDQDGVLGVEGVINLVKAVFAGTTTLDALKHNLKDSDNPYQEAIHFLSGRRGPRAVQKIIHQAVLNAHASYDSDTDGNSPTSFRSDNLSALDQDIDGWSLRPGVEAIGRLAASAPTHFGSEIITSNFDPLLQISLRRANVKCWSSRYHTDGDPSASVAEGVRVVHIHGYWIGSDALHTPIQLTQERRDLQNWMMNELRGKTVVVMAYGGWDDIFMRSLKYVLADNSEYPEVIWTFFDKVPDPPKRVTDILSLGQKRGRLGMYSGIDCHEVLPIIANFWENAGHTDAAEEASDSRPPEPNSNVNASPKTPVTLPAQHADRPPKIDHWVGRSDELQDLLRSEPSVVAITGIGGEGKSYLAARYLELVKDRATRFTHSDWRDCKEQSDTIRTKLSRLVDRLTEGRTSAADLAELEDRGLVNEVITAMDNAEAVVVLDNVDHYVDFEARRCIGLLDALIKEFARSERSSRLIFTCRPNVEYGLANFVSYRIEGLTLPATIDLYRSRVGSEKVTDEQIGKVHSATNGHAFWNDILASQLAFHRGLSIDDILRRLEAGDGETPDILRLVWKEMPEREQKLLRVMAETVRPESLDTLEGMLGGSLNFSKLNKAMKSLQSQNLVVRKVEPSEADLFDLHPLVRTFVRSTSLSAERSGIIKIILDQYAVIIGGIGQLFGVHLPSRMMERYSERAELEIEIKDYDAAFETLEQCVDMFIGSGNGEQFVRVSRKLFASLDWETASRRNPSFLNLAGHYVEALAYLGHKADVHSFLDRLGTVVPSNTADFIRLCNFRTLAHWILREFEDAISWGREGVKLKETSGLDTDADCKHNLSLSLRDGGHPEDALTLFLEREELSVLLDYGNESGARSGPLLGNVARCLQLVGRHDEALVCLHRSWVDIEKSNSATRTTNRSWLREWVGNSLEAQGKIELASIFYQAARALLTPSYPGRIEVLESKIRDLGLPQEEKATMLERKVQAWFQQDRVATAQ